MLNNNLPKRKRPRLKNYDYSQAGSYFITICVKNRECILGEIVGRDDHASPTIYNDNDEQQTVGRDAHIPPNDFRDMPDNSPFVELSSIGETVDKYIRNIDCVYGNVKVDNYVIMPNHIHLLITCFNGDNSGGMRASRPTIMTVVRSLKTMVTKQIGYCIWQESFFDRIVRNEDEYLKIWKYIDDNPIRWFYNNKQP